MKDTKINYNYILIQNTDEKCYGYFIIDKNWMSTKCVELVLKMDVLNSYSSQIQTETLTFNSNSYIYRAHQNRYNMNQSKYIPADSSEILYRYVNDVSEGLEFALKNAANQCNSVVELLSIISNA